MLFSDVHDIGLRDIMMPLSRDWPEVAINQIDFHHLPVGLQRPSTYWELGQNPTELRISSICVSVPSSGKALQARRPHGGGVCVLY